MVTPIFNNVPEVSAPLMASMTKANQMLAANFEKMLMFQMNAFRGYLDIGLNQMKAAAEITDMKSLQTFYRLQSEIAQTVQQKLLMDVKAMTHMGTRFKVEMDNLARATWEEMLPKAA